MAKLPRTAGDSAVLSEDSCLLALSARTTSFNKLCDGLVVFLIFSFSETGSCFVAEASLVFGILLLQPLSLMLELQAVQILPGQCFSAPLMVWAGAPSDWASGQDDRCLFLTEEERKKVEIYQGFPKPKGESFLKWFSTCKLGP